MDSDEGKLFVGGIAWDTTEEKLRDYFGQYGDVSQTVIMRDKTTGRPRGFGFVVFSEPSVLDAVLNEKHTIDGRAVEAKRALSKEEQQTSSQIRNFSSGRSSGGSGTGGGGGNFSTKKIFVGGLPSTLTEDTFRQFFESFGQITDVVIMYDQTTQRPRGFGFITFDTEEAVDRVLCKNFHELNGKAVEVKRALPKDSNPGGGLAGIVAGASRGGYQNYTTANATAYDNHRTMQTQTVVPPYSGYNYGVASSAVGYGGFGGGYGYGAASYGNPNAPNAVGFVGAMKTAWGGGQAPAGYGAAGFAPRGQAPSGASGYGYANYAAGNYGPYAGAGGYGGDQQGNGGYGDNNGSGSGYSSSGWRSDPSQGGYSGGALSRQV